MPESPAFELFEVICYELSARKTTIIPADDIDPEIIEDLKNYYGETADQEAFRRAILDLDNHFKARASTIPFTYESDTGRFIGTDTEYIEYIAFSSSSRGIGGDDSRDFEIQTLERLAKRLTGGLHRVGVPRNQQRKKAEFAKYLEALGFRKDCLEKRDKDGGFDLLWLPPLGAVPLRPVVSLQCKNSFFNEGEANKSAGRALRTLNRHSHVSGHHHLVFVVFNDYIDESFVGRAAGWIFLPLGLSDLGQPTGPVESRIL
jgi:hypothetical protein